MSVTNFGLAGSVISTMTKPLLISAIIITSIHIQSWLREMEIWKVPDKRMKLDK